jgi:hypothetical protein
VLTTKTKGAREVLYCAGRREALPKVPQDQRVLGVLLAWLVTLAIVTVRDRIGRRYTRPRHASKRHLE